MAVDVIFLDDGVGVEMMAHGIVRGHEIIAANQVIAGHDALPQLQYHIINKYDCIEYDVSSDEMFTISSFDKYFSDINPNIIMAIVESRHLQYTLSHLWQHIVKEYSVNNQTFIDRPSALNWIFSHLANR